MPTKLQTFSQLSQATAKQITAGYTDWTAFLKTAARLYKYPYHEQLMIYAQRPEATACAEYDFWNDRMGRYVRRGSKGIALIDLTGDQPKLRYVFDISDTGGRNNSRSVNLWKYQLEHEQAVSEMLKSQYNISSDNSCAVQLECAAAQLADEYWNAHSRDILDIVDDSFLYGYDDFNVGVAFRNAATVSITYSLMSRCGLDPEDYLDKEDFLSVFDFNTPEAAAELGTAVSVINQEILRQIERTVKQYERNKVTERIENHVRDNLHEAGGLSSPEHEALGAAEREPRKVRQNEEELSSGTQTGAVQPSVAVGEAHGAPFGDREIGAGEVHSDRSGADSAVRSDGSSESLRPDEMGGADELYPSNSGRNDPERANLRIEDYPTGEQLSLFDISIPTQSEQIAYIDSAGSVKSQSAFSIPQEYVDGILRTGGNSDNGRMGIVTEFSKQKSDEDLAEFLKNTYKGGNGLVTDNGRYAAWYAEDGIHIAKGEAARYMYSAQIIPWDNAVERVKELLNEGNFATIEEVNGAKSYELSQMASHIWYMHQDFSDGVTLDCFPEDIWHGGFPDSTEKIAEILSDESSRQPIIDSVSRLAEAYADDKSIMRFNLYSPDRIVAELKDLSPGEVKFSSRIESFPENRSFITQDEIDDCLVNAMFCPRGRAADPAWQRSPIGNKTSFHLNGSGVSGGKGRIYAFFNENHTSKERIDFLKNEYGTGGRSHALSSSSGSFENHDGKGVQLEKDDCADVNLTWSKVAERISSLISKGRYLTPQEKERLEEESRRAAGIEAHEPETIAEERQLQNETEEKLPQITTVTENFCIAEESTPSGFSPKSKFRMNMDAINLLKELEFDGRQATAEEQTVLSKYVGWGGLAEAFDPTKENWQSEYSELKNILSPEEYETARASTLNAHYTSPTIIKAIYEAIESMGFKTGNILEPAMGVGNFFGLLPESMQSSRLYGVELDDITGRIAKQLYPKADITVAGFETTDRRDFYDLAVGNVPFGNYKVNDRAYNKLGFSIHDYFFAKTLDQVRPGGVIAFVTSRYTMDKQSPEVRKYIAERAELLGAIRLPNNAFKANAGTEVVSDIIFLQKRDRAIEIEPEWVHLGKTDEGFAINSYFIDHPEMILGRQTSESTQYGRQDFTVTPIEGLELADQLHDAVKYIHGKYQEAELPELGDDETVSKSIPADPNVKNYSYAVVDGEVYFRENSVMVKPDLNATAMERVKGLVELRDCVHELIDLQLDEYASDSDIKVKQEELNTLYDGFSDKYGLINDRGNRLAFSDDSSYYLLCSLEILNDEGGLKRKADMFTKHTIRQQRSVSHVETASEALAVSIGEHAKVDLEFMSKLSGLSENEIVRDLRGVIFKDPVKNEWQTADEYLSGNVRQKLREAKSAEFDDPAFEINVSALTQAQPKDLEASDIEVRLGATWIDKEYIRQFMLETFKPSYYLHRSLEVNYSPVTAEWNIGGKNLISHHDVAATKTFGTDRASAYRILEETLNLRDIRIYDTVEDADGKERRVLNQKETTLAAQKQQAIKDAFKDWLWRDPERRQTLVKQYNEEMNSTRPREYDGSHIVFSGMNPEISLREHQRNAIAHVLYGGNTLLAHEVGAGKSATRS